MQDADHSELTKELAALRAEIDKLNDHRFVRAHDSYLGLIGFNFLRGLALGLGTVFGATILVSIAAYFLAQIEFVPLIGDWAVQIVDEIQSSR